MQVTQRVYEHVAATESFDDLRSTRHFGVMTFYFVYYKDIDGLLLDMLKRNLYVFRTIEKLTKNLKLFADKKVTVIILAIWLCSID